MLAPTTVYFTTNELIAAILAAIAVILILIYILAHKKQIEKKIAGYEDAFRHAIHARLKAGYSKEKIVSEAAEKGWSRKHVHNAIKSLKQYF